MNLPGCSNVVSEFMPDMKKNLVQLRKTTAINHGKEFPSKMVKTILIPIPMWKVIPTLMKLNLSVTVLLLSTIQMDIFMLLSWIYLVSTISLYNTVGALGTSPMMSRC